MKNKVLGAIKEYNLVEANDNILIGLSGGPDSMALLYVLLEIREEMDFDIFIAHVNHGVRGKEALEDEKFVKSLADRLGLPCFIKNVNMNEYAKEHKLSSEEAGRELRYSFFRDILSNIGGGKIAVAHNKNDQAETLLMRFFRGTGIEGLKGMEYKSGDIIRPILGIEREEIEEYLSHRNIESRLDKTNLETVYSRNRIRLEIFPYIEKYYNPNIIDTLWRTSQLMITDDEFLERYSKKISNEIVKKRAYNSITIDGVAFVREHRSIQQRIIRNCISDINGGLQGITSVHISDIINLFLKRGTGKSINIINNIIAKTSYDSFILEKNEGSKYRDFHHRLNLNGFTYIEELGYGFNVDIMPIEKVSINNKERFVKCFDFDKIIGDICVRNRKDGDRFVPFGMKGSKKIKDYFIDEKIPQEKRNRIPLIIDDKNILWVVGYRTSDLYRITDNTKNVIMIELVKRNIEEE